jgi:murein DD-endopeptidase MepM/ murein hydrolase activator NlpD
MRKTFLRAPLDFIRVSSEFNLRRLHPVHKKIKAHRGIDYSAPRGTPVYAAGDGIVEKAGYNPANGNFVFLRHTREYTTKYLHFDKRLVRTGQRVKQGQQIGTVGSTGYSTGPHLHYEFLLNGVHRNPREIAKLLPPAIPIEASEKARFNAQTATIKTEYALQQEAFKTNGK